MPDWSYQTLFRPLLFRLSCGTAREFTLGAMGYISKMPGGSLLIRTLGHMESSPILKTSLSGIEIKYPVGLSGSLDIHGLAPRALAQFGLGFMEIGPVTLEPITSDEPIQKDVEREAIWYPQRYSSDGVEAILQRLAKRKDYPLPLMFRTRHNPDSSPAQAADQQRAMLPRLLPYASGLYLDVLDSAWPLNEALSCGEEIILAARAWQPGLPIFFYIPLDCPEAALQEIMSKLNFSRLDGLVIGESMQTEQGFEIGKVGKAPALKLLGLIKDSPRFEGKLIVSAGIHEPLDALELMQAGADYIQLHSGLVYSGPGLPKRINEAIVYERIQASQQTEPPELSAQSAPREQSKLSERSIWPTVPPLPTFWGSWGWMYILGLSMVFGGILALIIAASTVVLPYDTEFLGIGSEMINSINAKLLPFMSHDRITLAGTMISIGVMYTQLGRYGLSQGVHWSKTALMVSGLAGFGSFFLFLGYGYFDPLHGLVAIILLPMFLIAMRAKADQPSLEPPNVSNSRQWRLAQWGQLMFVILGFALAVGGATISIIGITHVFVPTDLVFLNTTPQHLAAHNDHFMPLIAHDRAGFGGALFSNALAILATALWGINQGQRWLWWTFLLGGLPGFAAGLGVHAAIGYTDFWHLLPAYFAVVLYVLGLIFLYPYLMGSPKTSRYP